MKNLIACLLILITFQAKAQQVALTKQQIIAMTPDWKGDRLADGRPNVPDQLLERLKNVTLEEAWGFLRNQGYNNQFEGEWIQLRPDQVLTGRALTVQYFPRRPDYDSMIRDKGKTEKRIGNFNSWPIDMLKPGDVYVADGFGKIGGGTLMGSTLANAIYSKTGNGVVFNGAARDLQEMKNIKGFNAFVRGRSLIVRNNFFSCTVNFNWLGVFQSQLCQVLL